LSIVRRGALLLAIALLELALFEGGLRLNAGSEAAPGFRELFMPDDQTGYRLRPGARTHFVTSEFESDIAINDAGVRDEPIGPKEANERRIVILGDSLVMAVQVSLDQTFVKQLERRLNATATPPLHYRVINAGVQGYGPVEELLFYQKVAAAFQPDLVIQTLFVANDASDALGSAWRLSPRGSAESAESPESPQHAAATNTPNGPRARETLTSTIRRLARTSMVYQIVRLRFELARERVGAHAPERPLRAYLREPSPDIDRGLEITKQCLVRLRDLAGPRARVALILMPARLQVDDVDYGHLRESVAQAGGLLVRDEATDRFRRALQPLGMPMLDPLPAFRRALPGPDIFYQTTVHLTPHGHELVADALAQFVRDQHLLEER
jgi:lysophospholipase L1-like esterase